MATTSVRGGWRTPLRAAMCVDSSLRCRPTGGRRPRSRRASWWIDVGRRQNRAVSAGLRRGIYCSCNVRFRKPCWPALRRGAPPDRPWPRHRSRRSLGHLLRRPHHRRSPRAAPPRRRPRVAGAFGARTLFAERAVAEDDAFGAGWIGLDRRPPLWRSSLARGIIAMKRAILVGQPTLRRSSDPAVDGVRVHAADDPRGWR